jgi:hypothetical protein
MKKSEIEKKMMKASRHHFNNIARLAKKPEPSKEELAEMYGYLNYCLICDKEFKFMEPFNHGFEGNTHMFGCSTYKRLIGVLFNFFKLILCLILIIPVGIYEGLKWIIIQMKGGITKRNGTKHIRNR